MTINLPNDDAVNHDVYGSDGVQPIYYQGRMFWTYEIDEIYTGGPGKGKYVPNEKSHVVRYNTNERWYVKSLDKTTLIPELEPLGYSNNMVLSSTDLLFSAGPGDSSKAIRIYLDTTVYPYRLDVDAFAQIRQVQAAYAKIIYGPLYGEHEVISMMLDATGNLVSDRIPLSVCALEPGWTNYSIKTVDPCFTNRKFKNGDMLTLLVYSQSGHVLSSTPLSVVNSNTIRDLNQPLRYIRSIGIESPYLSETEPNLLLLPLNWTRASMNMVGVVHYSDGKTVKLPIDERKFKLVGGDQLLSNIPTHEFDMSLNYMLDPTEAAAPEIATFSRSIPFPLRVRITEINNSHTAKLFGCLFFDKVVNIYRLRWWLLNMDRRESIEVTSHVKVAANSPAFNGSLFGTVQRLQVTLNLRDVFPTIKPFYHTQVADITIYGLPTDYNTPWIIKNHHLDEKTYGGALHAEITAPTALSLKSRCADQAEWLDRFYYQLYPLVEDPNNPALKVKPTHVLVKYKTTETRIPVTDWDHAIQMGVVLETGGTVQLTWIKETATGDLYLAAGGTTLTDVE